MVINNLIFILQTGSERRMDVDSVQQTLVFLLFKFHCDEHKVLLLKPEKFNFYFLKRSER